MSVVHGAPGASAGRGARLAIGVLAATTVLLLVAPRGTSAQAAPAPGTPDDTFGGLGRVLATFTGSSTMGSNDEARGIALQPDGKLIVAGTTSSPVENEDLNFAAIRLLPNGAFDPSFGDAGGVIVGFGQDTQNQAAGVAVARDGKIVLAGRSTAPSGDNNFALVRYNPDGTLDSTFGASGGTLTDLRGGSDDQANAVAVLPDGKILAAGFTNAPNGDESFAIVRYLPDGNVDAPFGGSTVSPGRVITDFGDGTRDNARAIVVQPDGKIVAAGFTQGPSSPLFDIAIARYTPEGLPDTTFGTGGRVVTDIRGFGDDARGVALQPDGKIVIAGASNAPNDDFNFVVARYNPDGTLDAPFGQSSLNPGISLVDFEERTVDGEVERSTDQANAVAIQADGRIVAAGFSTAPLGVGNTNFALVRLDPNGVATTGFGTNNRVLTDVENTSGDHTKNSSTDRANAIAIQADGRIVVAGGSDAPVANANQNFGVVRYLP